MHHELHNPEANTAEYGNGQRPRRQPPVALVLAPFLQQLLRFVLQLVRLRLELVRLRQRPVDTCNLLTKVRIGGSVARARSTARQCGPEKPANRRFFKGFGSVAKGWKMGPSTYLQHALVTNPDSDGPQVVRWGPPGGGLGGGGG